MIATPERAGLSSALRDVIAECDRQVSGEGYTSEHDDEHDRGELAAAGAAYALQGASHFASPALPYRAHANAVWPFDKEWWKPRDARRDLVRAAGLIVKEIERIDRARDAGKGEK